MNEDEKLDDVAARLLREHHAAFAELAKMIRFSKKKALLLHQIIAGAGGGSAICFGTEPDRCFSRTAGAEGRA